MSDTPRALIIEEDSVSRIFASLVLTSIGLEVEWARSGEEALVLVRVNAYHLILVEYSLSDIPCAADFIRKIRSVDCISRTACIIGVTSVDKTADSFEAGLNAYLRKPVPAHILRNTAITCLQKHHQLFLTQSSAG